MKTDAQAVIVDDRRTFDASVPVLVIGGGACGLTAALAARDAGSEVLVLERDATPSGSTALSSGFIPAPATRFQRALGVEDSPELLAADMRRKNHDGADEDVLATVCREAGPALEWLADRHGIPFHVLEGFLYPGHSVARMHAVPEKTGAALIGRLLQAAGNAGVDLMTEARVTTLIAGGDGRVRGVLLARPDGTVESIGCGSLVLACNGYGGKRDLVERHIPGIASGVYAGHVGNQGDALRWGEALGARAMDLGAYQGHGSWATPHNILITWALMMEGGIQVNANGERFWNEHEGYSEAAVHVLAQPGGVAWCVYDERLHQLGLGFPDYLQARDAGAVRSAAAADGLARLTGLPSAALVATVAHCRELAGGGTPDAFGRDFAAKPALAGTLHAIKVTGALFHTQGGLEIDAQARVLHRDTHRPLPGLYAGGGAARGLSGAEVWGYLSGNGLLSAVTLGRIAGRSAAQNR